MKPLLKTGVVILPFLAALIAIRACAGGAAGRWQSRIERYEPGAQVVIDADELIVIAADPAQGEAMGEHVQLFREALIEEYGDLLGRGRDQRTVVVLFSSIGNLQAYADGPDPRNTGRAQNLHGFTIGAQNAIFLPPDMTLETLHHETVHLLMEETYGGSTRFSPWLTEGLAQLFEVFDPEAVPPTPPGIGQRARWLVARTISGESIDVERLLRMQDYEEFTGVSGTRNYLEALVLTAFLFERRSREQLREYIELERSYPTGRPEAFARVYRHRERQFVGELAEYLRRLRQGTPR